MLTWKVYVSEFSSGRIKEYNIFNHAGFVDDCRKMVKKCGEDKDVFAEAVRRSLMYHYWSKCEWEIILQHWPPNERFRDEKIDVYDQVRLNWDIFINYLWENRKEFLKKK